MMMARPRFSASSSPESRRRALARAPWHSIGRAFALLLLLIGLAGVFTGGAFAQNLPPDSRLLVDRPISGVRLEGLSRVSPQKVRNNMLTAAGDRFDPRTIQIDIQNLYRLGDFRTVTAFGILQDDGSVVVVFEFREQPVLTAVQTVGNNLISDQELLGLIALAPGVPADEYLIDASKRAIQERYREKGHYLAEVAVNQEELDRNGILLFSIIEGPRVKIRAIEFEGNDAFTSKQLLNQVKSREAIFLLNPGRLDEQVLSNDVATIDRFYKDRGYLDVRVGREIQLSPDSREAKLVFLIQEGRQYVLRTITVAGNNVFSKEQIAALIEMKTGDVFSQDKLRRSLEALQDAYGVQAYVDARVTATEYRTSERPEVDVLLDIREGERALTGEVIISGDFLTKDKVIRRELEFSPNRPLSTIDIRRSEARLRDKRLFRDPRITIQDEDPNNPGYRDVLVEIKEVNTGSLNFGVAVGSDSGLLGSISVEQRNFDIADVPETFSEMITGRAFRGAGQRFSLVLAPGNEVSQYSVSFSEPNLFDSEYSLRTNAFLRDRIFRQYDESRLSGSIGLARRIGKVWSLGFDTRFEHVELGDIEEDAPVDVFDAEGPDVLTGVGVSLRRITTPPGMRPGRGTVLELSAEQVGLLGGDYDFTKLSAEYTVFLTLAEDFIGRRSILKLNTRASYIPQEGDAPVYERYYLGGRSFRGFDFRTVSPKGIRNDTGEQGDDPVGGNWLFFAGGQYEFPIFEEVINGVLFVDSGTVLDEFGFDDYRVSAGFGLRLYIAALGPVPIAFDFGFPIVKEDDDERQLFSFSAELPF